MARLIVVSMRGEESRFALKKLERRRLYGSRKRVPLDAAGVPCRSAQLTRDGRHLVRSGMTAQGYFRDDGVWLSSRDLVGLGEDGEALELIPGTLGVAQEVCEVAPSVVLDLAISTVYQLDVEELGDSLAEALEGGGFFRFALNYRADYRAETAVLLQNKHGFFALVGVPVLPSWVEPDAPPPPPAEDDLDDELDFEMF